MNKTITFVLIISGLVMASAQTAQLSGEVKSDNEAVPFATITAVSESKNYGTLTNEDGSFSLTLPYGTYTIIASSVGYKKKPVSVTLSSTSSTYLEFELEKDLLGLEQVVVSATRNLTSRNKAPVIVSTIQPKLLTATQSISLADGLNYAPGVRVETNCQNCGFTQVRLNGLDGGYTQILVNSRPVFTSLLGVYGLEQIPTNSIDRVEVVRSGGSALFGSNAIAGTVNVITKDPVLNTWEIGSSIALLDGKQPDRLVSFNTSVVADNLTSGVTVFGTFRDRDAFDANNDGFTEITKLVNNTLGTKAYVETSEQSKLSINLNAIKEYRRGGDRLDLAPQFTDITEELDHTTIIGGADFEIRSKTNQSKIDLYASASHTDRDSYYGGLGGARTRQDSLLANNAFGKTKDLALVNGAQYTKYFNNNDVLTAGAEYQFTNTKDEIQGYDRLIDQRVSTLGVYSQYEWKPNEKLTTLLGARLDNVTVDGLYRVETIERSSTVTQTAFSPRLTLAYKLNEVVKFRGGYARGFRAPQAFNEDLHISSVGGEPQFVLLSNNLETEYSNAFTASINLSKSFKKVQTNALIEGFYTEINNPFTIVSTGRTLSNGSILEEVRNGSKALVYGSNFEFSLSPSEQWQFQVGGTYQRSRYKNPQLLFESDDATNGESDILVDEFVRTPNLYGFINTSWLPNDIFSVDVTGTYTGAMTVPRVISDTGFLELNDVDPFFDLNIKLETHYDFSEDFMITLSTGVKNMFNSYQDDFESGPTRDSDYIYGPNAPRTFFVGLKFGKLH